MGRLDAEAKRKVVELRAAGLSFRKIKAVLELENIRVSAQAIYLFLKEFHGRNGTKMVAGGSAAGAQTKPSGMGESSGGVRNNSWRDGQLGNLMREASRVAGYSTSPEPPQQSGLSAEDTPSTSRRAAVEGASRAQGSGVGSKEDDEDIRIVSVTSMVPRAQQDGVSSQRTSMSSGVGAMTGIFARRRLTPSPATNPVLLARKRLLDKALLHRARQVRDGVPLAGQQMTAQQRREPLWRNSLPPQVSIDLTTSRVQQMRRPTEGSPDSGLVRRGFQPRMSAPAPRVGIRLPSPSNHVATTPPGASSNPSIRIQHAGGQQPQRREPSPSYQPATQEAAAAWQGLGEQVQSLGSEIRTLGVAIRILVEQQSRLEREQMQQTQVQKQILSTLKLMASRMGPSIQPQVHTQSQPQPHTQTQNHTLPSSAPSSLGVAVSYSQPSLTSTQGSFSQRPLSLGENSRQESATQADTFSLPSLSSAVINGFGSTETSQSNHPLSNTHSHIHTLSHASNAVYTQPLTHTSPTAYTQSLVHTPPDFMQSFTQSHVQQGQSPTLGQCQGGTSPADAFASRKDPIEFSMANEDSTLQECGASIPPISPLSLSPQDAQLNIIKVEAV